MSDNQNNDEVLELEEYRRKFARDWQKRIEKIVREMALADGESLDDPDDLLEE